MKRQQFFAMLVAIASATAYLSTPAKADNYLRSSPYLPVTLSVQGDNEGSLREFPLSDNSLHYRAYIQAMPNERYRLRVVNNSDQRVGLVIAVDGRNIISGQKSWLSNNERMYILNPHDSADYEGWRTGTRQTNRFYFTEANNSYAAAWGDTSSIGVIAMAVYAERIRPGIYYNNGKLRMGSAAESHAPAADSTPGTGFGETTYSPSIAVDFEPNPDPMEKIVLKYEWRETLCRKGILPECYYDDDDDDTDGNRSWRHNKHDGYDRHDRHNRYDNDNSGFAPPPPR